MQQAPLELRELKAQQAPPASALALPGLLVLALRVQRAYKVLQVLQVQLAPLAQLVSGQPACRVLLELLELPAQPELLGQMELPALLA